MKSVVVVGAQWGDEGKGKVVDIFPAPLTILLEWQAATTRGTRSSLERPLRAATHPLRDFAAEAACGDWYGNRGGSSSAGGGNCDAFQGGHRRQGATARQQSRAPDFSVSPGAGQSSGRRARRKQIGTTSRGIGPRTKTRWRGVGLRMCDLLEPELFKKKAAHVVAEKNRLAKGATAQTSTFHTKSWKPLKLGEQIRGYLRYRGTVEPCAG